MKKFLTLLSFAILLSACGDGGNQSSYSLGGQVSGLVAGQQVSLRNKGADLLVVKANGNFTFQNKMGTNDSYAVTVATQPTGAVCTVSHGEGAGVKADVKNVIITCSATTYTISGTVQGLLQTSR